MKLLNNYSEASQNMQLLLGKPLLSCSISNQYQKLQLLQARSFADMVRFIQVKKLLVSRSWEYCLLFSTYSRSEPWTPTIPKFPPSTAAKPRKRTPPAQDKQWTWDADGWELELLHQQSCTGSWGQGGLFSAVYNPVKALENAFKKRKWTQNKAQTWSAGSQLTKVTWPSPNKSLCRQPSPWFNILLGFCLQCATGN